MSEFVSIKVDEKALKNIKSHYSNFLVPNDGEYVFFVAKVNGITITGYSSKSAKKTITFDGKGALKEAKLWDSTASIKETKEAYSGEWLCLNNQIGSDEVGVGDSFLPMIVVASFVRNKDIKILKQYNVTDSKKLTDKNILEIGEALSKKFFISKLTISNEKYNEMYSKGENINSLKAKMHNRALLNLLKQFPETKNIFVDQFCLPNTYYSYLNDDKEPQVRNITFRTKGESYYPSVALSSVIARYSFLKEKEKLEEKYKMKFPFGSGNKADEFGKEFIKRFGEKEFSKISKMNFKNIAEIKKDI